MDNLYRPIYSELYASYGRESIISRNLFRFPYRRLLSLEESSRDGKRVINRAIEQIQRDLEDEGLPILREDAKYFLMICFSEMIYNPINLSGEVPAGSFVGESNLSLDSLVTADIRTISRHAAESTKTSDGLISAHALIDSLPKIWGSLRTGATRIWEGRQNREERQRDG